MECFKFASTSEVEVFKPVMGERRLWVAVLGVACRDAIKFRTTERCATKAEDLEKWALNDVPEPFNLIYICTELLDSPGLLEMCRKTIVEGLSFGLEEIIYE